MPRNPALSLKRLRHHRGLWALVMAALLIKLVSSSLCLTDGVRLPVSAQMATASVASVAIDSIGSTSEEGDCMLGEGGTCHCACAHAATFPAALALDVHKQSVAFEPPAVTAGFTSVVPRFPLRPPIS